MVGRQIVTSDAASPREVFASIAFAAPNAFSFGQPVAQQAPFLTTVDMSEVDKKVDALTKKEEADLVQGIKALLETSNFSNRAAAYVAWTSAGVNQAAVNAFVEVVNLLNGAESASRFSLDSTHAAALSKRMREAAGRAINSETENFSLSTLQQLYCTLPTFQKSWGELIKMATAVGGTATKPVEATGPEPMEWFSRALEAQQARFARMTEQNLVAPNSEQSVIFGRQVNTTKKHPLLLNDRQFRQYVGATAIMGIYDKTRMPSILKEWQTICDMVKLSEHVKQIDAVVSVPAAAVWKAVSPSSILKKAEKDRLVKAVLEHGLVAATHLAKTSILEANARMSEVVPLVSQLIPSERLPSSTPFHALMTRVVARQRDPKAAMVKLPANTILAEEVLSYQDEGCLDILFPRRSGADLGPMVHTPFKIVTAKLDSKGERVLVENKVDVVPLASVDKALPAMVREYLYGRAMLAARQLGLEDDAGAQLDNADAEPQDLFN